VNLLRFFASVLLAGIAFASMLLLGGCAAPPHEGYEDTGGPYADIDTDTGPILGRDAYRRDEPRHHGESLAEEEREESGVDRFGHRHPDHDHDGDDHHGAGDHGWTGDEHRTGGERTTSAGSSGNEHHGSNQSQGESHSNSGGGGSSEHSSSGNSSS